MSGKPKRTRSSAQQERSRLARHFTENRILESSVEVFTKLGVTDTRVEDLIAAAGVSRRTFYKYYPSKEAVLAALYTLITGKLAEMIRGDAGGELPTLDVVFTAIDAYLEFHTTNGTLLKYLMEASMRSDSLLYPRRRWLQDELVKMLTRMVHQHTGQKVAPQAFYAVLSMLEGLSLYLLERPEEADFATARRMIHGLVEVVIRQPADAA